MPDGSTTLAELVHADARRALVLERFGLDYCCGGGQPLGEACAAAGVDSGEVLAALEQEPAAAAEWAGSGIGELIDHLLATHHRYLHENLPRIDALFVKVVAAHGGNHPELLEAQNTFGALRSELEPHLMKEEQILFPASRALELADAAVELPFGTVEGPITVMRMEHEAAGELLRCLRDGMNGFVPPDDACESYRVLCALLDELTVDTHLHIHKENDLLFPAVMERQAVLGR